MTNTFRFESSEVWFHRSFTLFCIIFFLVSGFISGAEEGTRKVVRIPFQRFNRLMELDENNNPASGYAYEYIEKIGIYAGWDIKYIPCDSFSDGVKKLIAGEADVFYDVSYTEDRAKEILFPDEPMGFEYYFLYSTKESKSVFLGDIDSIKGKTVGVTTGTMLIDILKQWCASKNVELKLVEYDSIPEKEAALLAGKLDLDLEVSMLATNNLSTVEKIGSSAYYLVANKERPDLIKDINSAMDKVLNNDLFYFSRLQERYFSETVLSHNLTREEENWIANHKVLRVGFFDNYLPFSALDKNGEPIGACIEAVREIIRKLKLENDLKLEFICYQDQKAGYKAVEFGEVDIMLPAYISNSVKHDYRIMGGKILATLTCDLVFLDDFGDGSGKRIGVNRHNIMQYYNSRDSYPNSEIVLYDNIRSCLEGVLNRTSDGTFLEGLRSEALLKPRKYNSFKKAQTRTDFEFHMAFAENNLALMLLMDRGLTMLAPTFVNEKAYSYLMQNSSFDIMDYIQDHILLVLLAVAILVAGVITLIWYRFSIRKLEEFNRKLKERSDTIEKQSQQESELRKQLEDALQKTQVAYDERTIVLKDLENASDLARLASFHYNFDTHKRSGSSLLCELWPVDETGRALLEEEWVYPEDLPNFKQNMKALLEKKDETNGTVQFSFRAGLSSDKLRYYRMKLTLDQRNPNAVTGIVQDVTELTVNMLKLKDTQALWDAAINAMPIMFTVKDVDNGFRYLLCNNAFAAIFNSTPNEIAGKTDQDLFDNKANLDFTNRMNHRALSLNLNETEEFEEDIPVADGSLRSIKTVMRMIQGTSGHRLLLAASSDVTDERNKREELQRAMTNLENASQMARLAWFRYEIKTHKRSGSKLFYTLWPEDENGEPIRFENWVHPDDIQIFARELEEIEHSRKPGETATFSFRIGKGPNLRYIRALTSLDLSNPDEPTVVGILQDVTELTLNMLKLKDTQALWNIAINSIPIMFSVKDIDNDFRYLLCNKAFSSVFNVLPDEIVGKTDHEIFHDETTLGFADRLNTPTTGNDGLMEIEGELPDGNGNLRYIKTIMRAFEDVSGHHLLLAAANDVTDMHRLLQNQSVINKLLEDIIGEDDFALCIQRTLETVCKILGASRGCLIRHEEDTKAHCVFEYVEPSHAHASYRMLDRALPRIRGVMEDTEDKHTFICNDIDSINWKIIDEEWHKTAITLDLRAIFLSNIVIDGKVKGTVGFNFEGFDHTFSDNDISLLQVTAHILEVILARKHAQTLIMDALAHAQAADKAKSFFIASVSHEIRTPLNSVIGFADLLREGGVSQKQEKEYLDAISSSANALLMLINDVLDLSKLEANRMQIITAFTDFNALCHEVMLIFTFRAKENGNKLVSDVPEDLPELDIDNIRIRQILINLFGNAVKFTKDGTITLHVSFTPDPDSADTGTLRCAVSDTGIGISEEDQKKLMEPFVQLSGLRGTNAVNNGTGLGLSISKRLAVCMNGELTCISRIGEGSTFAVTLNSVRYRAKTVTAVKEQSKSKPEAKAIAHDVKNIKILIVDDVPMNLLVAKALFNKIGFNNISTAGSGRAALELLGKQKVDLILSDMWMPEMNGTELSAEVKKDPRFAHIPIVAQTADAETNGNFDMSHFDAIILKPLTKEKLSKMVKRIILDGELQKGEGGAPINLG